jgi:hypothetical protein
MPWMMHASTRFVSCAPSISVDHAAMQRLITLGGSLPVGYRISTLMFFRAIHCA